MRLSLTRALLLSLCVLSLTPSCSRKDDAQDACVQVDAGTPVDPVLLSFLSRARAAHHLADGREQAGDLRGAVAALEALTTGPTPQGAERPEVREVLADTQARLADSLSRLGDGARAFEAVDRGLSLVPERSYFRGHLFEVRGLLEERQAEIHTKSGDLEAAKAAKERALSAFEQAMKIQAEVIEGAAPKR